MWRPYWVIQTNLRSVSSIKRSSTRPSDMLTSYRVTMRVSSIPHSFRRYSHTKSTSSSSTVSLPLLCSSITSFVRMESRGCRSRHVSMHSLVLSRLTSHWPGHGHVSTRSLVSDRPASEYKAAAPFDEIPKPGPLCNLPYVGGRFLFKPFSKYPIEAVGHRLSELHETLGPIFRLRSGRDWSVHVERLEDVEQVFRGEEEAPYRKPIALVQKYNERSSKTIVPLIILNGPEWRRLRSPMNALMNRPVSVRQYVGRQEAVAEDLARCLFRRQHRPPHHLQDLFFRFASESVGVVCFNRRLGFLDDEAEMNPNITRLIQSYKSCTRHVMEALFGKRILYLFMEDQFFREYKEAKETTLRFTMQCIREASEEIARSEKEGTFSFDQHNFLLSLLTNTKLSDRDVYSIVDALMTAGADSTGCSLQLVLYALATHPDQQSRAAQEVLTRLGPDGHLSGTDLDTLTYLQAAVKEATRLYFPTAAIPGRRLLHDTVLSGYQVPRGTTVTVSSLRMSTSPQCFEQPLSFLPERWLRGEGGRRLRDISPLAHIPFGLGPRNCIGRRFAMQELYLATAKILQKYHIGVKEDGGDLETIFTPFRTPKHPLSFTFTPRLKQHCPSP